ncbi:MAG: poly-gamma-glutamate system protein [Candidatus Cloacimonadaceae bacterium]|nr:poly-gamma-glutamate system protein [Candidatus Cloacimonadota bacterium]MDY0128361.1 poly-gamma-glutamate system protein [Candidatus Cloacimonadaceae bacterium]MCB5254864.1 poly-gamma-glutamate system protein [Candidatus Cloacimonadota bacterium]MCK9177921.1 poly-gamma-glutamate system protein [Candidatus Cloacimonadota bacterium]MCK9242331.1 poly-gamma-glutamate system protein [Candidatus Cloacimonadota bacterium]
MFRKMYRPNLRSGRSLILLFVLSIILYLIASHSYVEIRTNHYEEKLTAVNLMQDYLNVLQTEIQARDIEIDPINDPFQTGLIGTRLSSITTDRGLLSEKQAAINPNIAAIFVEELSSLKAGDNVAIGITGSNPAVNLALYAALTAMQLEPSIIVSLSSASYGANREELTWLDIEAILKEKGMLSFGANYASIGGSENRGIGLSDHGMNALRDAMSRNNVPLILGGSLEENVDLHMQAYDNLIDKDSRYRLFVNIGGGLANVGSEPNARLIPEGLNTKLAERNFDREGVMMKMAKRNINVLHIRRIIRWANKYQLSLSLEEKPVVGEGTVFSSTIHNVTVASICLAILIAAIIAVIVFDRHDRRFMGNIVDPDEEL